MKRNGKRYLALALGLVLSVSLTGCGGGSGESTTAAAAGAQSGGRSGGKVNSAIYATYDMPALGMDPSSNFNNSILSLLNIYDTLLRYNAETDDVTYVACDKYESSEDSLTWTFHIREGMTFHDGTPVNAEAAKFSFERTVKMGKGAAFIWDPDRII